MFELIRDEVIELSSVLLDEASLLLVNYLYPEGNWGFSQKAECKENLGRLLDYECALCYLARRGTQYTGLMALNWGFSTTKGRPFLRIQDLYVLPEYRKQGVARLLVEKAIEIASRNEASRIQLNTNLNNHNARKLYKGLGFEHYPDKTIYMKFLGDS